MFHVFIANYTIFCILNLERKMGPQTILSYEEETVIANWVLKMAKAGFPLKQLQDSAQRLMTDLRRDNPFADNRPGRTWIQGFYEEMAIYLNV